MTTKPTTSLAKTTLGDVTRKPMPQKTLKLSTVATIGSLTGQMKSISILFLVFNQLTSLKSRCKQFLNLAGISTTSPKRLITEDGWVP